jgi:hypothetical protein
MRRPVPNFSSAVTVGDVEPALFGAQLRVTAPESRTNLLMRVHKLAPQWARLPGMAFALSAAMPHFRKIDLIGSDPATGTDATGPELTRTAARQAKS